VLFCLILLSPKVRTIFMTEPRPTVSVEGVQIAEPEAERELNRPKQAALRPAQPLVDARVKKANPHSKEQEAEAREEEHEASVAGRIAELRELASKTDRASLETLLAEVKNPDHEIRQAVLDIIGQSGRRDAIPDLLEAAAQTEDPGVKKAITEVIDFLKLPTLTEVLRHTNPTNSSAGSAVEAKVVPTRR
jgi:hypothetical protein